MRRALAAIALSLSFHSGPAASQDFKRVVLPRIEASVTIPAVAEFLEEKGPDFWVFRVMVAGRQLVGMYIGQHPQKPDNGERGTVQIGSCLAEFYDRRTEEGASRDVYLGTFHFFYRGLSAPEVLQADAVIGSFAFDNQRQCN
jgi:hypothetical protein